jgi:hypothetical protein
VVRHLEAAGLVERASDQAVRAARDAAEALAFGRAAAMYEVALRLGNPPAELARQLRIEMADALVNAGRGGPPTPISPPRAPTPPPAWSAGARPPVIC